MKSLFRDRRGLWVVLLLVSITLAVYWPVVGHPFIALDDEEYVTRNPGVLQGLTPDKVLWAFTTLHSANWHPLTWLSHMADVELFGLDAGWHHGVNLLLHMGNTLLLFLLLWRMTGSKWRSAFVGGVFAVHPLHVETVAWIAERKDLLCAFFGLLATWAYWRYTLHGGRLRHLAVTGFFLLGLLSKPMLVTLPFVFFLLDYWPLHRIAGTRPCDPPPSGAVEVRLRKLVLEKVPWLLMSLASCIVTYVAQREGGAMWYAREYPFGIRVGNAVVSYLGYLGKYFWPDRLSVFYPHPAELSTGIPAWKITASVAVLLAISSAAWRWRQSRPYLLVGWLFFLGTLVPVIGLVQVGLQGMADRYMYIPLIGLSLVISWSAADFFRYLPGSSPLAAIAGGVSLVLLSMVASVQVSRWRDSVTLFRHSLGVTSENWMAYFNLADALLAKGEADAAISLFREGLKYRPGELDARLNLGRALGEKGRYREAVAEFGEILRRNPGDPVVLANLGVSFHRMGRLEEALECLRSAVERKPDFVDALTNLGAVLLDMGREEEADLQLQRALRLSPGDPFANELMREGVKKGKGPTAP